MRNKASIEGDLSFISLSDIFQILGGNGNTGVLRITSQYVPNPGQIYFANGDIINARNSPLSGLDAIYAMFGWTEGRFEFYEEDVQVSHVVKKSRMEILLDAMRMLDDGIIKKVGPPSFEKEDDEKQGAVSVVKGPLVDYTQVISEEEYSEGDTIAREGGHGKWIWVILKGTVDVTRNTTNGPLPIIRLGEGCFLGNFKALTFKDNVRSATLTSDNEVQLGLLDIDGLSMEYMSLSPAFKALLLSLDTRLRKITDRAVELYIRPDYTKELIKDKKLIIKKGSPKEEIFSIKEGETYVVGETSKGYLPLMTLEKDEVFGHWPFLDMGHETRSAAILASNYLKVNRLNGEALKKEYDELSGTLKNMIYNKGTCIFVTTKLAYQLHSIK
ncbi:MAG: DUF4388 domain-containing protein [Thermodesulfobacteriota bacterium]|nr:DUF4388 domain-containing protein [Thermodesulfobacteriota bacterium]